MMTGVNMVHVPYRGNAPALIRSHRRSGADDVCRCAVVDRAHQGGQTPSVGRDHTRALGDLAELPAVSEFLPGFEAGNWFGIAAPKDTPPEIVDRLNKEINAALADPTVKARLAVLGASPFTGSSADFGKFIAAEAEKWTKVIRTAGIKAN